MTNITNTDLQRLVIDTNQGTQTVPITFRPIKVTLPFPTPPVSNEIVRAETPVVVPNPLPPGANPSGKNGIPLQLLTISAVQTPLKEQNSTASFVTVEYTFISTDKALDHINLWVAGYHGNPVPQLIASGVVSVKSGLTQGLSFTADATGETVTIYGQTVSSTGLAAPVLFAKSCKVALNGQVSAPPAPTISQSLVGTPTGFQFGYSQVSLPPNDAEVIQVYKIYRATVNSFGSASQIATQNPTPSLSGSITFTDTINTANGSSYFYWVSAVNTAGFESTATAAQSGAVLGSIGSIPPSISTPFTISTTTSTITITTSPSCFFTRSDGTHTMIGATTTTITGMTAGNTVFVFPYWRESDQTLQFVLNTDATIPTIVGEKNTAASSQYIETTTAGSIPSVFSVEMWVMGSTAGALFDYSAPQLAGVATASICQAQITSGGEVQFSIFNGSTWASVTTAGASMLDSTWHHIVCTYSAAVGWIFVDGQNTSDGVTFWTNASMGVPAATSAWWHFGFSAGKAGAPITVNLFNSFTISLIALYTTALTVAQETAHLQAYCNLGMTAYLSELTFDSAVNLWKLNETSGTNAADFIGSNTGTYKGTPTLNQSSPVITVVGTPVICWPFNALFALQQQFLRNRTPLSTQGIGIKIPVTGTGGGSGGGSGGGYKGGGGRGGTCFTGDTLILTDGGEVRIDEIKVGDKCLTAAGNWRPVVRTHYHEAESRPLHVMPKNGLVTAFHKILHEGKWCNAQELFPQTVLVNEPVYTLSMFSSEPLDQQTSSTTERSFTLGNGFIASNIIPKGDSGL